MNFLGIGGLEIVVIAALALFLLGPRKMIETSRNAGKVIRELRAERDKFTDMVMQEFDEDDVDDVPEPAPPDGAVSRSRGRAADAPGPADSPGEEGEAGPRAADRPGSDGP